ncbi:hypothetical protein KVR01_005265 [Diaporthe batatas]|uniref:uncharacterized protein n=1 Tax=Diaporthe batatas TaxID=748121 RepID=UPI001D052E90|nr:uncharacterized protein KVR01_005265 [Diaporthe batatas]KAG8164990.1 hypothetical protein KVR01_005265 [Diaporthe batatas]
MIRTLARATVQPSMRTLAHPRLLLGQRLAPAARQPQQLRPLSLFNAVPFLGRRRVDRDLKAVLDQALSIKGPEQKQHVFFDVARRFAANNGGPDGLEFKSPGGALKLRSNTHVSRSPQRGQQRPEDCQCSADKVGFHNMRYAIDISKPQRWKVWAAVEAELRPPKGSSSPAVSAQEAIDSILVQAVAWIVVRECGEFQKKLTADTKETANGEPGAVSRVPDEIDLELLVWDTVIPLEVDTRKLGISTYWVGKLGEGRPWKNTWFPIFLPFPFLDF